MILRPSDRAAVVATVDPDVLTAGDHVSDWVDMSKFERILAIAKWGTLGSNATFDAKLEQAQNSGGTGAKDISGKAITQIDQSDSPDPSDGQALINCRADELDVNNGFTHVRLSITVATASCDGDGTVLGFDPRNGPASDNDLASVAEIVG